MLIFNILSLPFHIFKVFATPQQPMATPLMTPSYSYTTPGQQQAMTTPQYPSSTPQSSHGHHQHSSSTPSSSSSRVRTPQPKWELLLSSIHRTLLATSLKFLTQSFFYGEVLQSLFHRTSKKIVLPIGFRFCRMTRAVTCNYKFVAVMSIWLSDSEWQRKNLEPALLSPHSCIWCGLINTISNTKNRMAIWKRKYCLTSILNQSYAMLCAPD